MDQITRIRIKNARAIEAIEVDLSRPLTVLIGENGAGKSTIIECLELLRKAADPSFIQQFYHQHRGLSALLRKGTDTLEIGLVIQDDERVRPSIDYAFALTTRNNRTEVGYELLLVGPEDGHDEPLVAITRNENKGRMFDQRQKTLVDIPGAALLSEQLVITSFGNLPPQMAIERLLAVLRGIEVHLPFDTTAAWAARAYQFSRSMRSPSNFVPASRLELLGVNLASAWQALLNRESAHRNRSMDLVRLGIGERVDSVIISPDAGGGSVSLAVRFVDLREPVLASELSDGQLAWLAFVAMVRTNESRTLLAIDEPELHLHPHLLGGVIAMLQELNVPVLVATHSDRVLELLENPADAVRVCEFNEQGSIEVARLNAVELPRWLEHFGDFGRLRDAGYLRNVLLERSTSSASASIANDDEMHDEAGR